MISQTPSPLVEELGNVLDAYKAHLQERSKKPSTIVCYATDAKILLNHLQTQGNVSQATLPEQVYDFLEQSSPSTRHRRLASLLGRDGFIGFASEQLGLPRSQGYVYDQAKELRPTRIKYNREPISTDILHSIISGFKAREYLGGVRDAVITLALYNQQDLENPLGSHYPSAVLRTSDLVKAKSNDVSITTDKSNNTVHVAYRNFCGNAVPLDGNLDIRLYKESVLGKAHFSNPDAVIFPAFIGHRIQKDRRVSERSYRRNLARLCETLHLPILSPFDIKSGGFIPEGMPMYK